MRIEEAVGEERPIATVYIVDDDDDVRATIAALVRSVGLQAAPLKSAKEFLEVFDPSLNKCLILDMRMPEMTGMELQQHLIDESIQIPIIFVTAFGEVESASQAMRAGAIDYLLKPYSPQQLLERVHEALAADEQMNAERQRQIEIQKLVDGLTAREQEILQLLIQGDSSKVIARKLHISQKTVDNHRAKVLEKMRVDNPAQLAYLFRGQNPDDDPTLD